MDSNNNTIQHEVNDHNNPEIQENKNTMREIDDNEILCYDQNELERRDKIDTIFIINLIKKIQINFRAYLLKRKERQLLGFNNEQINFSFSSSHYNSNFLTKSKNEFIQNTVGNINLLKDKDDKIANVNNKLNLNSKNSLSFSNIKIPSEIKSYKDKLQKLNKNNNELFTKISNSNKINNILNNDSHVVENDTYSIIDPNTYYKTNEIILDKNKVGCFDTIQSLTSRSMKINNFEEKNQNSMINFVKKPDSQNYKKQNNNVTIYSNNYFSEPKNFKSFNQFRTQPNLQTSIEDSMNKLFYFIFYPF